MKKVFLFLIFSLIFLMPNFVLGADALYRMLNADKVESFQKDQDVFLLGQIISKENDFFIVSVIKTFQGKISAKSIKVKEFEEYSWQKGLNEQGLEEFLKQESTPKVKDFALFSLKKVSDYYQKAWGVFETTNGDLKTLKVIAISVLDQDAMCIENYVYSDGKNSECIYTNQEEINQTDKVQASVEEIGKTFQDTTTAVKNTPRLVRTIAIFLALLTSWIFLKIFKR